VNQPTFCNRPTADELLEATTEWMAHRTAGETGGFLTRVAANVLDTVSRELAEGPGATLAAEERLAALGFGGGFENANRAFAEAIRNGAIDPADPAVRDHLWQTTLDMLAIDNPRYATLKRARSGDKGTD